MDKGSTKTEILNAALDLFSVQGFEATSVSQIAQAVGIQKASLYSHFPSKQAILDALVEDVLLQYRKHSIFAEKNRDNYLKTASSAPLSPAVTVQMIRTQIHFILHEPYICKARKMLVLEQYQNPFLAKLQTKQNYDDVMDFFVMLVRAMIQQGVLYDKGSDIMAAQLCLPITAWISLCDREPEREPEIMTLVERHIRLFFEMYSR